MVDGTQTLQSYFFILCLLNAGNISNRDVLCHFQRGILGYSWKTSIQIHEICNTTWKIKLVESRYNFFPPYSHPQFFLLYKNSVQKKEIQTYWYPLKWLRTKIGIFNVFSKFTYISYIFKLVLSDGKVRPSWLQFSPPSDLCWSVTLFQRPSWVPLSKTTLREPITCILSARVSLFSALLFLTAYAIYFTNVLVYYLCLLVL